VLLLLLPVLFSGFLVNLPALARRGVSGVQYASFLFYLNELVVSDEMLGQTVTVNGGPGSKVHRDHEFT
jgi:hypothetical protein